MLTQKIQKIKQKAIGRIKNLMAKYHLDEIRWTDLDEGSSPLLEDDEYDGNNSFTLDSICLHGGVLTFEGSSCGAQKSWSEDGIDADILAAIADELLAYEKDGVLEEIFVDA